MKHEAIRELLDAYLDGDLPDDEQRLVLDHLQECAECAQETAAVKELLAEMKQLPRSLLPGRDLWPELEDILADTTELETSITGRRPLGWVLRPGLLAAAAVALLMVTVLVRLTGQEAVAPQVVDVVAVANLDAAYQGLDLQAAGLRRQVASALQQSETFPPEAAALLEKDIGQIDAAISDVRKALETSPGNRELSRLLTDYYMRKLDLLGRMNKLISADAV